MLTYWTSKGPVKIPGGPNPDWVDNEPDPDEIMTLPKVKIWDGEKWHVGLTNVLLLAGIARVVVYRLSEDEAPAAYKVYFYNASGDEVEPKKPYTRWARQWAKRHATEPATYRPDLSDAAEVFVGEVGSASTFDALDDEEVEDIRPLEYVPYWLAPTAAFLLFETSDDLVENFFREPSPTSASSSYDEMEDASLDDDGAASSLADDDGSSANEVSIGLEPGEARELLEDGEEDESDSSDNDNTNEEEEAQEQEDNEYYEQQAAEEEEARQAEEDAAAEEAARQADEDAAAEEEEARQAEDDR